MLVPASIHPVMLAFGASCLPGSWQGNPTNFLEIGFLLVVVALPLWRVRIPLDYRLKPLSALPS